MLILFCFPVRNNRKAVWLYSFDILFLSFCFALFPASCPFGYACVLYRKHSPSRGSDGSSHEWSSFTRHRQNLLSQGHVSSRWLRWSPFKSTIRIRTSSCWPSADAVSSITQSDDTSATRERTDQYGVWRGMFVHLPFVVVVVELFFLLCLSLCLYKELIWSIFFNNFVIFYLCFYSKFYWFVYLLVLFIF